MKRCSWVDVSDEEYILYHDSEWGVPVYDDRLLFEMLVLEGFQAGLSWQTILKKREDFSCAFIMNAAVHNVSSFLLFYCLYLW